MGKLVKNNAFKEIIPKESLTDEDKKSVLRTIANTKLFMEALDLLSVKHIETRFQVFKTITGNDNKID